MFQHNSTRISESHRKPKWTNGNTRSAKDDRMRLDDHGGLSAGVSPVRHGTVRHGTSGEGLFGDEYGSAIELYPAGTEMVPDDGDGQANCRQNASASGFTATHAAISIDRSTKAILGISDDNGWKALELSRGSFNVTELDRELRDERAAHTGHGT
jgi:hypothetical protein